VCVCVCTLENACAANYQLMSESWQLHELVCAINRVIIAVWLLLHEVGGSDRLRRSVGGKQGCLPDDLDLILF